MKSVGNCYVEKIEFLPDEIELAVTKTWCCSVISTLERMDLGEDLIYIINACIYSDKHKHDSPGHISRYVIMPVKDIKRIINICGEDTLCYILPYNYEQVANDFLCSKLGDTKIKIEAFMDLEDYDAAFNLINNISDEYLKRLSLIYMKSIYRIQTEDKITTFRNSRRILVNKIDSSIKESQYNY